MVVEVSTFWTVMEFTSGVQTVATRVAYIFGCIDSTILDNGYQSSILKLGILPQVLQTSQKKSETKFCGGENLQTHAMRCLNIDYTPILLFKTFSRISSIGSLNSICKSNTWIIALSQNSMTNK